MRTVPAHFLPLAYPELGVDERSVLSECGVLVGERVELDLARVHAHAPVVAQRLVAYEERVREFWDRYVSTGHAGECLVTRRPVATFTKVDNKKGKVYLKDQIEELVAVPGSGEIIEELLGASPDLEGVRARAEARGVDVETAGNATLVRMRVTGRHQWSPALGGGQGRGEMARVFELKISHAKSHDRRNQRLLEAKVLVEEVWPA